MKLFGLLPTRGPQGSCRARSVGVQNIGPSSLQLTQVPGEAEAGSCRGLSCRRGPGRAWAGSPRPAPSRPSALEHVAQSLLTFPQGHPRGPTGAGGGGEVRAPVGPRASHLDRGQGPGGCAGGSGEVGGAGCRHFRSSPSLLSTCCCVGPASTERARQPPLRRDLGLSRRADPPSGHSRRPAPVHLCGAARPACWAPW